MTVASARRRGVAGLGIFTALTVALLIGLGVWQLQRRVEKHALILALTERLAAAPEALPPAAQWNALTPARDEFRRVRFSAVYESRPDAMVYSAGSAIREDISGPGTWAFMPARLASGETMVIDAARDRPTRNVDRIHSLSGIGRRTDARGKPCQAAVVRARSSGDGACTRLG
jgi:cytochrome oxidase assembly protein ShyY1